MTAIHVHNTGGDARVFTTRGELIGPHSTRPGDTGDRVTSRLVRCGRLIEVTPDVEETTVTRQESDPEPTPGQDGPDEPEEAPARPADGAARHKWATYAKHLGFSDEDLEAMTRNEIRQMIDDQDAGDQGAEENDEATATGGAETDSEEETT